MTELPRVRLSPSETEQAINELQRRTYALAQDYQSFLVEVQLRDATLASVSHARRLLLRSAKMAEIAATQARDLI